MSRKKHKTIHIGVITAEQQYKMAQGRFLPTSGFGVYGDTKYNRRKQKRLDRQYIKDQLFEED